MTKIDKNKLTPAQQARLKEMAKEITIGVWGPKWWQLLQDAVFHPLCDPNGFGFLLRAITAILPCGTCRGHALEHQTAHPYPKDPTVEQARDYLVHFHNMVNMRHQKSPLSTEEAAAANDARSNEQRRNGFVDVLRLVAFLFVPSDRGRVKELLELLAVTPLVREAPELDPRSMLASLDEERDLDTRLSLVRWAHMSGDRVLGTQEDFLAMILRFVGPGAYKSLGLTTAESAWLMRHQLVLAEERQAIQATAEELEPGVLPTEPMAAANKGGGGPKALRIAGTVGVVVLILALVAVLAWFISKKRLEAAAATAAAPRPPSSQPASLPAGPARSSRASVP